MPVFNTTILKFGDKGEKTGWRYILVPQEIAAQMKPNNKKAFRVKGLLDDYVYQGLSLIPMGGGDFILALNSTIRKAIKKKEGATLKVMMEADDAPLQICAELLECLADEPAALSYFNSLAKSHQKYFSNWIEAAKAQETKARRIAQTVTACLKHLDYAQMIRELKDDRTKLFG